MAVKAARFACIVLALASTLGQAAEIRIDSSTPLPVPNLARNPGMEEGDSGPSTALRPALSLPFDAAQGLEPVERSKGGTPLHWKFTTAMPDNFETGWVDGGRSGKCLWVKAKTGKMSGYWNQTIPVEPGKTYLFKGYYRLAAGKILCYAHASVRLQDNRSVAVDQRYYRGSLRGHWLVPVFLPPEALAGPDPQQWYPFEIKATIPPPMKAISLSLGIYFTPGEAWFDDIWVGLAETDLRVSVKAGPGEVLERVVVRAVGEPKPVADSKPLQGATTFETTLKAQRSDKEYEVEVTLADGKVIRQREPRSEK
jgi:hypothetical protein